MNDTYSHFNFNQSHSLYLNLTNPTIKGKAYYPIIIIIIIIYSNFLTIANHVLV